MNSCWFFGDSFTSMNVLQSPWYLDYMNNKIGNIEITRNLFHQKWTTLISAKFKMSEKNFGKDGISNEEIIDTLLEKIPMMKARDYCFIQTTVPSRILGYNHMTKQINSINSEYIFNKNRQKCNLKDYYSSEEELNTIVNYINDYIIKHEESWDKYYIEKFNNIINIMNQKNINTILFTYKFWSKFETITEETNGDLIDNHWSVKGNQDFFSFIDKQLNGHQILPKKILLQSYINPI